MPYLTTKLSRSGEGELHKRINQHRSNVNNENNECPTFEISHFRINSFSNIRIEILEHVEDKNNRLARENDFMLRFRTIYRYGLITLINKVNIKKNS